MKITPLKINVCRLGDPPIYEKERGIVVHGTLQEAHILEGGMKSGATSVMLVAVVGEYEVLLETSGNLITALHSAVQGANERFKTKE